MVIILQISYALLSSELYNTQVVSLAKAQPKTKPDLSGLKDSLILIEQDEKMSRIT